MSFQDPIAAALAQLPKFYRSAIVITGAILIHLSLGSYHTFGNILPYMASYMKANTDVTVDIEDLVWIPTSQGSFPFAMIVGGYLSHRIGPRACALLGCALMRLVVWEVATRVDVI
uniref:Major facilitator superfamily (MFS) profile domain-containing protein n=1 Tax=Plectus sambesii TaxID=2011161 RepID=A0A914VPV9_9BILA